MATSLSAFAVILAQMGRTRTAALLLSRSRLALDEIDSPTPPWVAKENDETLAAIHAGLDETAFGEAWEEGLKLTIDEAVALALDSR